MMQAATRQELLITCVARLLTGLHHVAVGASSPIPAAGAMLVRAQDEAAGRVPLRVSILGSEAHNFFTNGGVELFDCAAQGRVDAFFLGGGQIDGQGNINLVGSGEYPQTDVRWPGSFGSSFMYFVVPRVILFREEHSPRVLVEHVDFVSAPGTSAANVVRPGGPHALLTGNGACSRSTKSEAVSGWRACIPASRPRMCAPQRASITTRPIMCPRLPRLMPERSRCCAAACAANSRKAIRNLPRALPDYRDAA